MDLFEFKTLRAALAALVLGLGLATGARAQSAFYREEPAGGRIYVFAVMAEYERWVQSREMGKAIARIGYGPGGETVVFDGPDAINLYNFKHDRPGEVFRRAPEPAKPSEPVAKVGGTIFSEYLYTRRPFDKDATGQSIRKSAFEVRRAYINLTGSISDQVSYRITPDIASRQATTASGLPQGANVGSNFDGSLTIRLKYAYGQIGFDRWTSTKGNWLRFGTQQTPYVDFVESVYRYRFEGTSFVDREGYLSSSDLGVSGRFVMPREYGDVHLGVYNGETYSRGEANDQKAMQMRASIRPLPRSAVLRGLRLTGFVDADRPIAAGARNRWAGALTYEHRFAHAGLEVLHAEDRSGATAPTVEADGWSLWLTPRTPYGVEALLRFDSLRPNRSIDARKHRTILGAAYWFNTLKSPLAAALLAEYETVRYDAPLGKPTEKRFAVKSLFSF
jgi:hypothetical protein